MAQQVKDPKLCPRDADSITGLALWVKDLALLQDEAQFTKAAWIWCCCGCGVDCRCSTLPTPNPGTFIFCSSAIKGKNKNKNEGNSTSELLGHRLKNDGLGQSSTEYIGLCLITGKYFFYGHVCSTWKFLGRELNPSHSYHLPLRQCQGLGLGQLGLWWSDS